MDYNSFVQAVDQVKSKAFSFWDCVPSIRPPEQRQLDGQTVSLSKPYGDTKPQNTVQQKQGPPTNHAQPPQKEFSRPSQQQVVAATDPNYETMRGLSNKELFQTNKKEGEQTQPRAPKEESQQHSVPASQPGYETLHGLSNDVIFQRKDSAGNSKKVDDQYECASNLDNAAAASDPPDQKQTGVVSSYL